MNPLKCTFNVTYGNFSGFIANYRETKINKSKIKEIKEIPKPKNIKELYDAKDNLVYI